MSEQPADVAQREAARQAVILVFSVIGVLVAIAAQRAAGDPDFYRGLRMRAAKAAERGHARLAAWSWRRAEQARVRYEDDAV